MLELAPLEMEAVPRSCPHPHPGPGICDLGEGRGWLGVLYWWGHCLRVFTWEQLLLNLEWGLSRDQLSLQRVS